MHRDPLSLLSFRVLYGSTLEVQHVYDCTRKKTLERFEETMGRECVDPIEQSVSLGPPFEA